MPCQLLQVIKICIVLITGSFLPCFTPLEVGKVMPDLFYHGAAQLILCSIGQFIQFMLLSVETREVHLSSVGRSVGRTDLEPPIICKHVVPVGRRRPESMYAERERQDLAKAKRQGCVILPPSHATSVREPRSKHVLRESGACSTRLLQPEHAHVIRPPAPAPLSF